MGRAERIATAADQVIELRRAAGAMLEPGQRKRVERVAEQLRAEIGESIPKARAASLLGVSVTSLEKWIARDKLPTVPRPGSPRKAEVETDTLLELAEEVRRLRESGERRALLAQAFARLDERRRSVESILGAAELIEAVSIVAAAGDDS